jgi:hypothetical protein
MIQKCSILDVLDELSLTPEVTDTLIARMIHSYYASYVAGQNPSQSLSLAEINDIYRQSQNLLAEFQ